MESLPDEPGQNLGLLGLIRMEGSSMKAFKRKRGSSAGFHFHRTQGATGTLVVWPERRYHVPYISVPPLHSHDLFLITSDGLGCGLALCDCHGSVSPPQQSRLTM